MDEDAFPTPTAGDLWMLGIDPTDESKLSYLRLMLRGAWHAGQVAGRGETGAALARIGGAVGMLGPGRD